MWQLKKPLVILALFSFAVIPGAANGQERGRDFPDDGPHRSPPCGCSAEIVKKNMDLFHINQPGKALSCNQTWCVEHKSFTCVGNENVGWSNDPC